MTEYLRWKSLNFGAILFLLMVVGMSCTPQVEQPLKSQAPAVTTLSPTLPSVPASLSAEDLAWNKVLEAAKKEGENKGKEKMLNEIKNTKRGIKERIRILFRPKTEVDKYLRKVYLKNIGYVAFGAAAMLGVWAIAQGFGYFLRTVIRHFFDT